nr:putative reverse transcriptase domain-containing protein [Tanacetum cinerariifolium]
DEDKDPKEDEFEEEEYPQEEEDDMEVDIEEDENEPELTYPYKEMDPLNPPPPASESEPKDAIEVENPIEHEDETIPASVHRYVNRPLLLFFTAHALVEKKGKAKDEFYGKLILDLGNEVRSSVEQGTSAMENLVEKLSNAKGKVECKKLKKELKEARFSNTFLRMQNERVDRDLCYTRVRAHEFYQEMIHRGHVFEERPYEAINVPIKDEKSPSSEIIPPKSTPMTQAAIHRMIRENIDAVIATERPRHVNVGNDARGHGPVRGAVELLRWFKKTESVFGVSECVEGKKVRFDDATLKGPTLTWWNSMTATMGLETVNQIPWTEMKQLMSAEFCPIEQVQRIEHELWNLKIKKYKIVACTQRFNELALMCSRMVELERVNVDAYIRGLTDNIKSEVTSSKLANLSKVVRMAHKLMDQKS